MNSETFIEALKTHVRDSAIEGTIANLRRPPGRKVSPKERARSDWYNSLSSADRDNVNGIIFTVAHEVLFGILVVLDGDRKIVDDDGQFELAFINNERFIINDRQTISLHEIFNAAD